MLGENTIRQPEVSLTEGLSFDRFHIGVTFYGS